MYQLIKFDILLYSGLLRWAGNIRILEMINIVRKRRWPMQFPCTSDMILPSLWVDEDTGPGVNSF